MARHRLGGFPPRASAPRWSQIGARFLGLARLQARALIPRLRARLHAGVALLEHRLGPESVDPELAACAFFVILIALTFLV